MKNFKSKQFDKQGAEDNLLPELRDMLTELSTRTEKAIEESTESIYVCSAVTEHADGFASALNILKGNVQFLKAAIGFTLFDGKTFEQKAAESCSG